MRAFLLGVVALCNALPLSAQGSSGLYHLELIDSTCAPGQCRCRGNMDSTGPLVASGIGYRQLAHGVACLAADLDGNHTVDVALTGSEGYVAVILRSGARSLEAHILDAGGVPELYPPRAVVGPHGEPPAPQYGLLVRDVGQYHVVFLWNGARFVRTQLPAWQE